MSAIDVDSETLQRYRQDVLTSVTRYQQKHGSSGMSLQMALASFSASASSSSSSSSSSQQQQSHHHHSRLRKCVLCGEQEISEQERQQKNSANSPQQTKLSSLDNLLQEISDGCWVRYDGLDHCFNCARRLACEILVPHFSKTRRPSNKQMLRRILQVQQQEENPDNSSDNTSVVATSSASATSSGDMKVSTSGHSCVSSTSETSNTSTENNSNVEKKPWTCPACGSGNSPNDNNCGTCDSERPHPLICPYCNFDASEVEFCPNDPDDPLEKHLTYERTDPVFSGGQQNNNAPKLNKSATTTNSNNSRRNDRAGRHDVWTCENERCKKLNLGIIHSDFCRTCQQPRAWYCLKCPSSRNNRYLGPAHFCPNCASKERAGSRAELEERDLCRLTGMTVEQARKERQMAALVVGAKQRLLNRLEKKLGFCNVDSANDGNCLFHAISFQLFRNHNLHHLLRLLAVEHIIFEKDNFMDFVHGGELPAHCHDLPYEEQREVRFFEYVKKLSMDGTWGDSLVLHALSRVFNSQFHVVSGAYEKWHNVISPAPELSAQAVLSSPLKEKPSSSSSTTGGDNNNEMMMMMNNNERTESTSSTTTAEKLGLVFISFIAELHYNSFVSNKQDGKENVLPYRQWLAIGDLNPSSLGAVSSTSSSGSLNENINQQHMMSNNKQQQENELVHKNQSHSTTSAANNTNYYQQPPVTPTSYQIQKNVIQHHSPFDTVCVYFPDNKGDIAKFLTFDPNTGNMMLSTHPQFFQRHIAADTPRVTKQHFPHKINPDSFVLLDEVGKHVVASLLPTPKYSTIPLGNSCCLLDLETCQRTQETDPRITTLTSYPDGSCCLGPWMFVISWHGNRPTIVMERPSYNSKTPAKVVFVEREFISHCAKCNTWYVLRPGFQHRCASRMF